MALAILFFVTALLYSAVGFGGGSTYNALLVLGLEEIALIPIIALACNLIVVAVGTANFRKHLDLRRTLPLVAASVPAAWLGGWLDVPAWLFVGLLAAALFVAGLFLLVGESNLRDAPSGQPSKFADVATGILLGLLAGVTGIGGGIYLAPLLYWRRWAVAPTIAATCAIFILANSLAGLVGQVMKVGQAQAFDLLRQYWPLLVAVLLGGLVGSRLGSHRLPARWLRLGTALLVLYVAVRLGLRFPVEWSRL